MWHTDLSVIPLSRATLFPQGLQPRCRITPHDPFFPTSKFSPRYIFPQTNMFPLVQELKTAQSEFLGCSSHFYPNILLHKSEYIPNTIVTCKTISGGGCNTVEELEIAMSEFLTYSRTLREVLMSCYFIANFKSSFTAIFLSMER